MGAAAVAAAAAGSTRRSRAGRACGRLARLFACLIAAAAPTAATADDIERVTDYRQDVTVAPDSRIDATETITVNAQGDSIVHGIYRDFPTIYPGRVHVAFEVSHVTLDGVDAPYAVLDIANGKRVRIGDSDTTLSHGRHVFTLHFATDRQIAFGKDHDELYWNVTGNGWDFAIDHVRAVVHLPANGRLMGWDFFTGPQGAHGRAARAEKLAGNTIAFETTETLDPNDGLTVDVRFAKGAVTAPARNYLLRDNRGPFAALAGLIVLLLYFSAVWLLVGRDPARGNVIPLYAPPHDLSPAAMRFIRHMHFDRKAFAATLVDLAVKGVLTIGETKHVLGPTYAVTRTGAAEVTLPKAEAGVAENLLGWDSEPVELTQANRSRIAAAVATLKKDLGDAYETVYFRQNHAWFWPGLGLIALSALGAAVFSDDLGGAFLTYLWSGLFGVATSLFGFYAFRAWQAVFAGPGARAVHLGIALLRTLAALPFAATWIGVTFFIEDALQPVTIAILAAEGVVAAAFYVLLRAPTLLGARLRDEIDGFTLYLRTAEQPRLEAAAPPQVTPALFEKFLPYAIALDCETQWSRKFEAAMAAAGEGAAAADHHFYVPMWYQGDAFGQLGTAGFASSIGLSLGGAVAAASVAPGGGSGGGGFSGGGGGGGGGGGW
ncbi:MAG: DUF2207 domain-containing protein [Rhizomicrobium sp.]